MARILITFIGVGQRTENGGTGYRSATYRFDTGETETSRLFGVALLRFLNRREAPPSRIVVLGTSGSNWDMLLEEGDVLTDEVLDLRSGLADAAKADCTTQAQLDQIAPLVQQAFGSRWELGLIPYGETSEEQVGILSSLAEHVGTGDEVILDLTHGFRHLPFIGLLSARYLQVTKSARIDAVYYGALDMMRKHGGVAPALRLDGLLGIADWVEALRCHDETGDYRWIARLLARDGAPADIAQSLELAGALERNGRIDDAIVTIRRLFAIGALERRMSGLAELFRSALRRRLAWARSPTLWEAQTALARTYLNCGDILRAATLSYEGFISRLAEQARAAQDLGPEKVLSKKFRDSTKSAEEKKWHNPSEHRQWIAFWKLGEIRHALVHGLAGARMRSRDDIERRKTEINDHLAEIARPDAAALAHGDAHDPEPGEVPFGALPKIPLTFAPSEKDN